MIKIIARFFGWIFSWVSMGVLTGLALFAGIILYFSKDVPDLSHLKTYSPATISRVYSNQGEVLDEFAVEKRLYTPANEIPKLVKSAFVSAEDKNFYEHSGYDLRATMGALVDAMSGQGERGASTIPQQVAKNFLLTGEQTIDRKITEVMISTQLVNELERDEILGLYLNEIFLGQNSYGVTSAARTYFSKSLEDLTISEAAYLAAIPKSPSNYHPVRDRERAIDRRNFVLKEMFENGYISEEEYEDAKSQDLETVQSGHIASFQSQRRRRDYFTDEIRRQLASQFGEDALFSEGISARATVDYRLQNVAAKALQRALENYDRSLGMFHGPVEKISPEALTEGWEGALANSTAPRDIEGWYPAIVLEDFGDSAVIGVEGFGVQSIGISTLRWARYKREDGSRAEATKISDMLEIGDVLLVSQEEDNSWKFRQVPLVSGAFAAIDPNNGRVLALQGGFSFESSNFNRATQALRQPGSVFKPFVYAAALDSGYQPNSLIVDAPIKKNTAFGVWEPENASGRYYGEAPMMVGLEQSRNLMTIRLGLDVGMEIVADYGERYGVYDHMNPYPANALGSQETTLYRLVSAFSTFANGGRSITPTVVDRVQDRDGKTIFKHDQRDCLPCEGKSASPLELPRVLSNYRQVMDPVTATQIRIMLQSVVSRGTARSTVGKLGLPIAGKTGTTNEARDVWFVGFTPNIVAGCYLGYDNPTPLWNGRASGGELCGPVFTSFMVEALKYYGGFDYQVPEELGYWVKLDRKTGRVLASNASGDNVVSMFFRKGVEPAAPAVIDGGYEMGTDVPLIYDEDAAKAKDADVKVNGEVKKVPKKVNSQTISGGGLY